MSVRIYEGLLIERDVSLADIKRMGDKLRPACEQIMERSISLAVLRVALRAHDKPYLGLGAEEAERDEGDKASDKEADMPPRRVAAVWLAKRREENKRGHRVFPAFDFEACLIGIGAGKTLASTFGGDKELREAFAKAVKAKPYGYWDGSDRDESITAKEWGQRKRDWQKAFGKTWDLSFADSGVTLKLARSRYADFWLPGSGELSKLLGEEEFSPAARAREWAKELCVDWRYRQLARAAEAEGGKLGGKSGSSTAGYVRLARQAKEHFDSEEGKALVATCARMLEASLPPVDMADLEALPSAIAAKGSGLAQAVVDRLDLMGTPKGAEPKKSKPRGI